jgi:predicted ATPase/class 3 adenylate cyclase
MRGGPPTWPYSVRVGNLTFLFTDIEGSTALLQRVGESAYAEVLAAHHSMIRAALAEHRGDEVDTQGDGFFAVFSSPRDCVVAALEMQQGMLAYAWPAREQVRVRMGMHTGEAQQTVAGLVGLDVHRAARIASVGYGGQVLVSETTAALVRDWLPPGADLTDLGEHRLKDLGRPERIFQLTTAALRGQFPPLRSLGNPALLHNLPAQPTAFVGRHAELAEVRNLVESSRLVTLTGAGGCGKTRLGLQVAAELLDGSGDGVWLVELARVTDPEAVATAVCDALRITPQPGRSPVEVLVEALAPQAVLIVLDNCEHLVSGCAKVADALLRRCSRAHLLATSREPLGIRGEAIYRVPSLSLPNEGAASGAAETSDAVALFTELAAGQGISLKLDADTAPLVVSVCRRLDGLPLAIELAAARLRSMSLTVLHDRLQDRFRLLTGGSRTAMERQQTLRAAVDWSYSLLTGPEQAVLRRLSVFADGFDLEAAEAVCAFGDIDLPDVADLVGSLVDKSLVIADHAGGTLRYRLLETIRQYAAEHLVDSAADGEAAAIVTGHGAHYLSLAERAARQLTGPEQIAWCRRLDTEQANLGRALEHAASESGGTADVLRFSGALREFWETRFQISELAADLILPVLDRPDADADPALFCTALIGGEVVCRNTSLDAATRLGEKAVELARHVGDQRVLVVSLAELASTYWLADEPGRGHPLGQESVDLARRLGDDDLLAKSLLAYLPTLDHADQAESDRLYIEAIACAERSGDLLASSTLHNNAGITALEAENIAAAYTHLQKAERITRATGQPEPVIISNMGWVLRGQRDQPGARLKFSEGLQLARRAGDRIVMSMAVLGLACVAGDAGDLEQTANLLGTAQAIRDTTRVAFGVFALRRREACIGQARGGLGDHEFELAYARGKSLSVQDIIGLAAERGNAPR